LVAVHQAIRLGLEQILRADREALLTRTRLVLHNPVLRSRNLVAQDATRDLFARALARRAGLAEPDLAATVQASAVLAVIGPVMTAWAEGDVDDLVAVVDDAFAALAAGVSR
jgi:hypothetical protein